MKRDVCLRRTIWKEYKLFQQLQWKKQRFNRGTWRDIFKFYFDHLTVTRYRVELEV